MANIITSTLDNILNNNRGSGGFSSWLNRILNGTGGYTTEKYFGDAEPYNAADKAMWTGRFVGPREILQRFYLGNEYGATSSNELFCSGMEDPSYLTFKVELGEWGGSISDMSTIRAIQRSAYATNTYYMDYDKYPMGLLDLNFQEFNNADFNSQVTYNAFNYLLHRNQDRRAQMLKDFVEGIYVLQKDFPYLFQKISGVQKLFESDPGFGQRLKKDTILSLTCLPDGIDQKIFHLMHLYRQAAWNDIYQRWELPDIFRYFKMIIYVFDKRSVQMGNGMFSPEQDYFPILAIECGPCEFVIKSNTENEYSQNHFDIKQNTPTIDVRVQNVQVYYENRLMQRVKFIHDLETPDDMKLYKEDSDETGRHRNWRFEWMQRMFMMTDEYNAFSGVNNPNPVTHYVGDRADDAQFPLKPDLIDAYPDDTWHHATVTDESYVVRNFSDLWSAFKSIVTQNTTLIRDSRQPDKYYFRNDLMHLDYSTYMYYMHNNMISMDVEGMHRDFRQHIAALEMQLENFKMMFDTDLDIKMVDSSILQNLDKPKQDLKWLEQNTDKINKLIDSSLYESSLPEMKLKPLQINEEKPDQALKKLEMNLDMIIQKMNEIDINDEKPSEDLIALILNLDKPDMEMNPLTLNLERMCRNLNELILNLNKPKMELNALKINLDQIIQDLVSIYMNLSKPDQKLLALKLDLDKPAQNLQEIIKNFDMAKKDLMTLFINLDKPEQNMQELQLNLAKAAQQMTVIILNLGHRIQELIELNKNLEKPDEELIPIIRNLEKQRQEFIDMIIDTHHLPQEMTEQILNIEKQKQVLKEIIKNLEKPEQDMTTPDFNDNEPKHAAMVQQEWNTDVQHAAMTEQEWTLEEPHHADMIKQEWNLEEPQHADMIKQEWNLEEPRHADMIQQDWNLEEPVHSPMVEQIQNTDKTKMKLNEQILNTDVQHGDMIAPEFDDSEPDHAPMIEQQWNTDKPSMDMTPQIMNTDVKHGDMISPEFDDKEPKHAPMIEQQWNEEKPDMDFIEPVITTDHIKHNLTDIEKNLDKTEMNMTEITMNTSHTKQSLIPQTMNTEVGHSDMIAPVFDEHHSQTMYMSPINTEVKQNEQHMSPIDINDNKNNELRSAKIVSEEPASEMKMIGLADTQYEPQMTDVVMQKPVSQEEMKMKSINTETKPMPEQKMKEISQKTEETEMQMTNIKDTPYNVEMEMRKVDGGEQKPFGGTDEELTKLVERKYESNMDLRPIENSSVNTDMKMQNLEPGPKLPEMNITAKIEDKHSEEQQPMKMSEIHNNSAEVNDRLKKQLETLTNIDQKSLENASIEQLVKLVGVMNKTLDEVRSTMKMPRINEVENKNGKRMRMPFIDQGTGSAATHGRMREVDEAALDRAFDAYKRNSSKKNRQQ